jgi:hypothetical protein
MPVGVDQQRADLEDLGGGIVLEPGGLEVDDRVRPEPRRERAERRGVDPDLVGRAGARRGRRGARPGDRMTRRRSRPCTRDPARRAPLACGSLRDRGGASWIDPTLGLAILPDELRSPAARCAIAAERHT